MNTMEEIRKTFEYFLQEKHAEQYTGTDDDMPDDFVSWIQDDLDVDTIIEYANQWGKTLQVPNK